MQPLHFIEEGSVMKPEQAKNDERDNALVPRWGVIAMSVVGVGALAYNYFGQQKTEGPAEQGSTQVAPQNGLGSRGGSQLLMMVRVSWAAAPHQ